MERRERMKRDSGMKGRDERSRVMEVHIAEPSAKNFSIFFLFLFPIYTPVLAPSLVLFKLTDEARKWDQSAHFLLYIYKTKLNSEVGENSNHGHMTCCSSEATAHDFSFSFRHQRPDTCNLPNLVIKRNAELITNAGSSTPLLEALRQLLRCPYLYFCPVEQVLLYLLLLLVVALPP